MYGTPRVSSRRFITRDFIKLSKEKRKLSIEKRRELSELEAKRSELKAKRSARKKQIQGFKLFRQDLENKNKTKKGDDKQKEDDSNNSYFNTGDGHRRPSFEVYLNEPSAEQMTEAFKRQNRQRSDSIPIPKKAESSLDGGQARSV